MYAKLEGPMLEGSFLVVGHTQGLFSARSRECYLSAYEKIIQIKNLRMSVLIR